MQEIITIEGKFLPEHDILKAKCPTCKHPNIIGDEIDTCEHLMQIEGENFIFTNI